MAWRPVSDKPWPEPVVTQIYDALWPHLATKRYIVIELEYHGITCSALRRIPRTFPDITCFIGNLIGTPDTLRPTYAITMIASVLVPNERQAMYMLTRGSYYAVHKSLLNKAY